jgi:hypothetical protein
MYSEQIYFDPNYGVSGENVLSPSNVKKAKFFKLNNKSFTIFNSSSSIIIHDLSNNINQTIYTGDNIGKINHVIVVDNRVYFCGNILNKDTGFIHFSDYINNQFTNVNLLQNAPTSKDILYMIQSNNEIHYVQENLDGSFSLKYNNYIFNPSLIDNSKFKSANLFSNNELYLIFESYLSSSSLYYITIFKIKNYTSSSTQQIVFDNNICTKYTIQHNTKHVLFNEITIINNQSIVIYMTQNTIIDQIDPSSIATYQLETNQIHLYSLTSSSVIKQLQVPNFFIDSISNIIQSTQNESIFLIGYGYTTLQQGIKYIVINLNTDLNLNTDFHETGYNILQSMTNLSPSRSQAIRSNNDFYLLNVIYGDQLMITKIKFTINLINLIVNFTTQDKVYDGTKQCTISNINLLGKSPTDDVSLVFGQIELATPDASENKNVIALSYDLSGNSKYKYKIDQISGSGKVTPRGVTGYFIAKDKNIDQTLVADVSSSYLTNLVAQDASSVGFKVKTAQFLTPTDGFNKTVIPLTYELSGNKVNNYQLLGISNSSATIKLPIELVYPVDSSESIFYNIPYKLRIEATYDQSFNIVSFSGLPPVGLDISSNLILGTPTTPHSSTFTFYLVNKYGNRSAYKTYTFNVLSYEKIDTNGQLPSNYINANSGTSFNLLDYHVENLVTRVTLYKTNLNSPLILGSNLQNSGLQIEVPNPGSYKFLFGSTDLSKNQIGDFNYSIFLKIFDASGYIINYFRDPYILNFYLDDNNFNTFIYYVGKDPLEVGGEARLVEKIGNKYKYTCSLQRGDGVISMRGMDGNKMTYPNYIKNIFQHLYQFNSELWIEYLTTPQIYIENEFTDLRNELSKYYLEHFEVLIPRTLNVSLKQPNIFTNISVSWSTHTLSNYAGKFLVEYSPSPYTNWTALSLFNSDVSSTDISGLTQNTTYKVRISGQNSFIQSEYIVSDPITTSLVQTPINMDISLNELTPFSKIDVKWDNQQVYDTVNIQYSTTPFTNWINATFTRPSSNRAIITNLNANITYKIRMSGMIAGFISSTVELAKTLTTTSLPSPTSIQVANNTNNPYFNIDVSWTNPIVYDSYSFQTSVSPYSIWTNPVNFTSPGSYRLLTVNPGTSYKVQIRGNLGSSTSAFVTSNIITTSALPNIQSTLSLDSSNPYTGLGLSFSSSLIYDSYSIQYSSSPFTTWISVTNPLLSLNGSIYTTKINNLTSGLTYKVRISGNKNGFSNTPTESNNTITLNRLSSTPSISITSKNSTNTSTSLTVSITSPTDLGNPAISSYSLTARTYRTTLVSLITTYTNLISDNITRDLSTNTTTFQFSISRYNISYFDLIISAKNGSTLVSQTTRFNY